MVKPRDEMRLLVGMESGGSGLPLRTDADGRLEVVNYRRVHAARVYHSAAQSVGSGAWAALAMDSEDIDTDGMHDLATNNSRITIVNGGLYIVGGSIQFAANATGVRGVGVRINGSTYLGINRIGAFATLTMELAVNALYQFIAGDYVELMAYQSSGGGLNVNAATTVSPFFWAAMF